MNFSKLLNKSIIELKKVSVPTAEIDARAILKYVLEQDDVYLLTHNLELVTNAQYQKFRRLIRRRKKGEPVAYLTGHKEFYGLDFTVNKNVLIPRPETERLVEKSLEFIKSKVHKVKSSSEIAIIDLGTGSGCVIISLIKSLPTSVIHNSSFVIHSLATDISSSALRVAKKNASKHEIYDNIRFFKSDLFSNPRLPAQFDLIIANLPYLTADRPGIKHTSPETIGLEFEPREALYAPEKGFSIIDKAVRALPDRLSAEGLAILEIDASHGNRLQALCQALNLTADDVSGGSNHQGFWTIKKRTG